MDINNYGKYANLLFYYIGLIFCLVGFNVRGDNTKSFCVFIAIVLIIVGIFPGFLHNNNLIDDEKHPKLFVISYIIMSVVLYFAWGSFALFFSFMFVQTMLCLMYLNIKFLRYQLVLCDVAILLLFIFEIKKHAGTIDPFKYFILFFTFNSANFVAKEIISLIEYERLKSKEQERSLDDMLRVIELKVDEARNAAKSKSDFLSNMSHEIRTPINAVLGMNEMITRESKDPQISEYSRNIASSGNMLLALVNDILDFSKIESGKVAIIRVEYQLSTVVNDLMNMIKERAEKKNLGLKLKINPQIPNYLYGDEVRIRQIVLNLLTNAVKYTDEGSITLNVDFVNRSNSAQIDLILSVKDTGHGIKKQDINKLFYSFQRLEETRNKNIEGTGLGLSIVGGYIKLMHGKIDVVSEYNQGSEFIVTLPQKVMRRDEIGNFDFKFNKTDTTKRLTYKPSFHAPKAKILVVDDNKMNIIVVKNLLKSTNIKIDMANGGAECIEMVKNNIYDIILLDQMMPEMDGTECLNIMRNEKLCENTPIIVLTANALSGAKDSFIKLGFDDYLSKPIVPLELENMLRNWIPKGLIEE